MSLTAEEVEQLRRIHQLSAFGELPEHMQALLDELLARDTDAILVAPVLDIQIIPQPLPGEDVLEDEDRYEPLPAA
jgi:hypothetical protein